MERAGFVSIFLGIENASIKNLRAMKKPNTLDLIRKGVEALQAEDISIIAGIITASRRRSSEYPGELSVHKRHGYHERHGPTSDALPQDASAR